MDYLLLILALFLAVLNWTAVSRGWTRAEYLSKPAVILVLLVWLGLVSGFQGRLVWFGLGLAFSLLGDVLLLFEGRMFLVGLVAFLIAHGGYIIGFTPTLPPVGLVALMMALAVTIAAGRAYRRVKEGLSESGQTGLRRPLLVYTNVVSLMALTALLTLVRPEWGPGPALLAATGGLLFMVSDGLLAWNRFVKPVPNGKLLVMVTYHLAQGLIVLGAAGQWAF